jgi:hypothetical protein
MSKKWKKRLGTVAKVGAIAVGGVLLGGVISKALTIRKKVMELKKKFPKAEITSTKAGKITITKEVKERIPKGRKKLKVGVKKSPVTTYLLIGGGVLTLIIIVFLLKRR